MIVQLTLEGHPVRVKTAQTITPGFYLMLVSDNEKVSTTPLTKGQAQTIIQDILGAE